MDSKTEKEYVEKFSVIDETLNLVEKQSVEEKSKKMAEKLLGELDNTDLDPAKDKLQQPEKIKLTIGEKLKNKEEQKKIKEEKKQLKEEKKQLKEEKKKIKEEKKQVKEEK